MGRSSKEQALLNRAKIVKQACALFREFGADNVPVAGIMSAAGMTTGAFYKHFASREALVAEASALAFEQASASWQTVLEQPEAEAPARRAKLVERYLTAKASSKRCPMIAFASHAGGDSAGEASREAYHEGTGALLSQFLNPEGAADRISPASRPDALVLFAAMVGARVLEEAAGDVEWTRALRSAVIDVASSVP